MIGAIGLDAFEGASRIAAWHLHEARRFYGELALPEEQAGAMTLSALIRKGGLARSATATPATRATQQAGQTSSVAAVATVTVAVKTKSSIEPKRESASTELTADEESKIRAWLTHIEETDSNIAAEVLDKCRSDNGARAYFLHRTEEVRNFSDT